VSNPITRRELVGVLRTRRAAALQIVVAALFAAVVLARWPSDARADVAGAQAHQVFRVFGYGLLAAVLLLAPAFPATSVVRERRSGTLALLLNSALSPLSIYLGKLAGSAGFALLLLSLTLPAATACFLMGGGVTLPDVAGLYGLLAVASLQVMTVALLVSTYARTPDSALRITYAAVFALAVVAPAPYLFVQGQEGTIARAAELLRCVSPVPPVMEWLWQGGVGAQGVIARASTPGRYVVIASASSLLLAAWTIARLNFRLFDRSRPAGTVTDDRGTFQRAARRAVFLVDPSRRKAGIGRFVNPVMVKEFRCRKFGRMHWLLRLVAFCAAASLGLTYLTTAGTLDWGVETIGGILVVLQAALILLIAPSLAAGLIAAERETGGWPLLMSTPLSAAAILRGKLMSVVWTLALILLATLPGYVVMVFIEPSMERPVARVVTCLVLTAVLVTALSAFVGSLFRRAAPATVAAYGAVFGLFAGTTLVWVGRDAPFGHSVVEAALGLNPAAAALAVIEAPGFERYELVPVAWWISGGLSAALFFLLAVRTWRLTTPQ